MKSSSFAVILIAFMIVVAAVFLDLGGFSLKAYEQITKQSEVPAPVGTVFEEDDYTNSISGEVVELRESKFYIKYRDTLPVSNSTHTIMAKAMMMRAIPTLTL